MANITNVTNVTNVVELVQFDNYATGGLLGLIFLIFMWGVVFLSVNRTWPFSHALTTAFFTTLVGSLLLQVLEIVTWDATAVSIVGTVIGALIIWWETPDGS